MIERSPSPRRRRFMAIFTRVIGCYVVCRFPRGFRAIVTAKAVARNAIVVELGIAEIIGVMAVFALVARLRVRNCLSNRAHAVMAGYTGFGDTGMVEPRYCPLSGRMATFTFCLRCNVITGLASSHYVVVATRASFWRTCEYRPFVTGIACYLRVSTGEWKAGGEVIELLFRGGGRSEADGEAERHEDCQKR